MRAQKSFSGSQRRRQMQRHQHKLLNRRQHQFIQSIVEKETTNAT